MNSETTETHSRLRRIGAWISLLALLLVYAPMASATLMVVTSACCTGDQCPIHGRHQHAENTSGQANESAMDCDHGAHHTSKMNSCSMSCCHTTEQAAVHAHIFLLTSISLHTALLPLSSASIESYTKNISPLFAPLAPPPKS
jgi:hypothetical protein